MVTELTAAQTRGIAPNTAKKMLYIQTAATADSGDTIDVTDSDVTGGETLATVDWVVCWDQTTGDVVTATDASGVITIDTGGSTSDHVYALIVVGDV